MSARVLFLDIETSPIRADVWSLRDQNVSLSQIREDPRCIAVGAKWYQDPRVQFWSEFHHSREKMLDKSWDLLDEADIIVHYNGNGFDIPWLNGEFARAGLLPPSPAKQIDLYRVGRKNFRFASHKLQYVSTALGLEGKVSHEGHMLWVACMAGDRRAWNRMRTYCKQDVVMLEPLYEKLRPWITNHPNLALYDDPVLDESGKPVPVTACPGCGSDKLQRRGFAVKLSRRYQRYQCRNCGSWVQDSRADTSIRLDTAGSAR